MVVEFEAVIFEGIRVVRLRGLTGGDEESERQGESHGDGRR